MQHDFEITTADANTGTTVRAEINAAFQALASNNSGIGDPAITYPYEFKFDTSESPVGFYVRKSDNTAWVKAGYVDATGQLTFMPTGGIIPFAGSSAPSGWLLCNGAAISRTTYAALFAVIGTTYGVGDGSTTFNVPNMKGKTIVGFNSAESEFDALGETGGEKTHTLIVNEMPAHTHTQDIDPSGGSLTMTSGGTASHYSSNTGSTGGSGAHNNLQPYITVNYIIKY